MFINSGGGGSSGPVQAADVQNLTEYIDDRLAALLVAGDNISIAYDDATGRLTITAANQVDSSWILLRNGNNIATRIGTRLRKR